MDLTKTLSRKYAPTGRECKALGMDTSVKLSWNKTKYTSANIKMVHNANLLQKSHYKIKRDKSSTW
jgi:hypothetical protein